MLALAGAALACWAAAAYAEYAGAAAGCGGPAPAPPAPEALVLRPPWPAGGGGRGDGGPWFIYLAGLTGVYALVTALVGASGAKWYCRLRLVVYVVLLSGLMLAEAGALVLLFGDTPWRKRLPADPSGWWDAALHFSRRHARVVKVSGLSLVGSQLAHEARLDEERAAAEHGRLLRDRALLRIYGDGSCTPWTRRMRSKYGVGASCWEGEAAEARESAVLAGNWQAAEEP